MGIQKGGTPVFDKNTYYLGDKALNVDTFVASYPSASGGTETTEGDYRIHTFTATGSDTFTIHSTGSVNIFEVLVVAGGGGGGSRAGGGGGGGGVIHLPKSYEFSFPTAQDYEVFVGDGGAGAINGTAGRGDNGEDSHITGSGFTSLIAKGGGAGGGFPYASDGDGADGGSGGGGQAFSSTITAEATQPTQSNDSGFFGYGNDGAPASNSGGDGGGGGGAGTSPYGIVGEPSYRDGGNGILVDISGEYTFYAGGGGGGDRCAGSDAGQGGSGGGGNGGVCFTSDGEAGEANTGGGGGGGKGDNGDGAKGGSGIVIIRYKYQ